MTHRFAENANMTPNLVSLLLSFVATVVAVVATAVAVASYMRVRLQKLPTVEFLVTRDASDEAQYWLSVSNPSRRLIILDWVEVFSPQPKTADTVVILPMMKTNSGKGETNLAWEEVKRAEQLGSNRMKPVYLAVPAGQTEFLHIRFRGVTDDEDEGFGIKLRLHWSKGLSWPYRRYITRHIMLDEEQVKARTMASFNHPGLPP